MQNVKRLEIVVDSPELPTLLSVLRENGADGYTIITPVTGAGDRGERRNDEPGGGAGNSLVITAVAPEKTERIVEAVRPILRKRGGVCLVSDAEWVVH